MEQNNPNLYSRGLIVPIGAAGPQPGELVTDIGGQKYNVRPFLEAFTEIGANVTQFARTPMDPRPLMKLQNMGRNLAPALNQARNAPPAVRQVIQPMVQAFANYNANAQRLIQMRLKNAYKISSAPKLLLPACVSIAAGATFTAIQFRNPYLGASGGSQGPYLYPWAITSFRTSNGESGALLPIRITQFLLGGHDYVAASLSGVTYAGTAAPATVGWPAAAFAETKRGNWKTEIQPWNVVANHGGGTGFGSIMTETGYLQIGVFNGGTGTYVDTYSVYANATLCGSPFADARWTQIDAFRKSFAPLGLQAPLAMQLAGAAHGWMKIAGVPEGDPSFPLPPHLAWLSGADNTLRQINQFLESPPEGTAMGDEWFDPMSMGMLPYGAEIVG